MRRIPILLMAVSALAAMPGAILAQTTGSKCDAARIRAAGKFAKKALTCHAKAARHGVAVDGACQTDAFNTFLERYAKAADKQDCTQPFGSIELAASTVTNEVAAHAAAQRPQNDASPCASRKLKSIGKGALGLVKCEAIAAKKGQPVDAACTAKASGKLTTAFATAESKDPGCFTIGDAGFVAGELGAFATELSSDIYVPPTPTTTPTNTRTPRPPTLTTTPTNTPTPRPPTPSVTATETPTNTFTPSRSVTITPTPTPTNTPTRTVPVFCSGSAPTCGGTCPVPLFCESNGTGGCRCVGEFEG